MLRALLGIIVLLSVVSTTPAAGILYFSQDGNPNGLYTLNTSTGVPTLIGQSGVTSSTVGLTETGNPNVLYGSQWFNFLSINANGSGSTLVGPADAEGLAYSPTTGTVYGAINGSFFTINPVTGAIGTTLASPGADIEGLAWGNGGVYGLAGFSGPRGNLYFYNPATNTWTLIGFTGVQFNLPGLAFDPTANVLYAIGAQDANLYRLNPFTGAATVVGNTGLANTGGGLGFVVQAEVPEPISMIVFGSLVVGGIVTVRRRMSKAAA